MDASKQVAEKAVEGTQKTASTVVDTAKEAIDKTSDATSKTLSAIVSGGDGDEPASEYVEDEEGNLVAPAKEITLIAQLQDGTSLKVTTNKALWPKKGGKKKGKKVLKAKKGGKKALKKTRRNKKTVKKSKKN